MNLQIEYDTGFAQTVSSWSEIESVWKRIHMEKMRKFKRNKEKIRKVK